VEVKIELGDEYVTFLRTKVRLLEEIIQTTMNHELEEPGGKIVVDIRAMGNQVLIAMLEESSDGSWERLGIETDPRGLRYVDCYRAFLLMSCASKWLHDIVRDALAEKGQTFMSALSNAQLAAIFQRTDTGQSLLITGQRTNFSRQGIWVKIGSPMSVTRAENDTVPVRPASGRLGTHKYFLEPDVGIDGQPSPAAAVTNFFK